MTATPHNSNDDADRNESVGESDVLIGRLIDGEASQHDAARFERMAEANPRLWRALALRQQDMATIASHVERQLHQAERIDLPEDAAGGEDSGPRRRRFPWFVAFSGWAAVIAIVAGWSLLQQRQLPSALTHIVPAATNGQVSPPMSPDEHLREYLSAPFVLGEMAPTLLEVEELSDGRTAIRFLRRIEEVAFVKPGDRLPVNENGDLNVPPSELRDRQN